MGLHNIYSYQYYKKPQLTDTFMVKLYLSNEDHEKLNQFISNSGSYYSNDGQNYYIFKNCTSFTLPEIELKTEEYKYGNNSKLMTIPDYESAGDLTIELYETYDATNPFTEKPTGVVQLFVNLFLSKLFDATKFSYILNDYIPQLDILIFNNTFSSANYLYSFEGLKLTKYSKHTLDYSTADLCSWSLSFSYDTYIFTSIGYNYAEEPFALGAGTVINKIPKVENATTPVESGGTQGIDPNPTPGGEHTNEPQPAPDPAAEAYQARMESQAREGNATVAGNRQSSNEAAYAASHPTR